MEFIDEVADFGEEDFDKVQRITQQNCDHGVRVKKKIVPATVGGIQIQRCSCGEFVVARSVGKSGVVFDDAIVEVRVEIRNLGREIDAIDISDFKMSPIKGEPNGHLRTPEYRKIYGRKVAGSSPAE